MSLAILTDSGPTVTIEEIHNVEKRLGIIFPDSVRKFFLENNGGTPVPDTFPETDEYEPITISVFLTLNGSPPGEKTLETTYKTGINNGYLPTDLIPFAIDWGGNYLCFNATGQIYFLPMDCWHKDLTLEDNITKKRKLICDTFDRFINSLVIEEEAYE
ncbi:SMI1/KNR4 family protein [Microbulbifer sp. OS29]|uniref:SMI1/KNR4 family protein n=1 Tax=Microbulbifer okhotskensis TaxID=2926617 RepID=A0A9X2ENN7_9GAMM|nr:SMI1/KNR4 family protein [Microbulbifer okhotskensis]MCO1335602.1 SMI1/KNR4 family protein [Microbulbifer okhotskensis]